ncbi:putative ribonuclease H-like domain-containing protein, partial [Tanacetum coccineum]
VLEEKINVLNLEVKLRDNALVENKKKLEKAEKERDELKLKLEKFQNSSKTLNNLLEGQSESDKGYHAVPPPYTGNYMPPKPDLMFIDEQVKSKFVGVVSNDSSSDVKTVESKHETVDKDVFNRVESNAARKNNSSPPIIEDWNSDDEGEVEFISNVEVKTVKPSIRPVWNNTRRVNHKNFANIMTHPYPKRRFVPQAVLTKSGKLKTTGTTVNTARPVKTADLKPMGNPQQKEYKEKGVINSGCSRHITGNKFYLTEFEEYDGGFVSFRDGKGRISRKGKIKTGTLDFDDVYFCEELKYNLFSMSQMRDKKNNVLLTDTECLVLSSDFKLLDESQVLIRVLRKDNIYSVDLKSIVPTRGLTCLFTKAIIDESNLWHRRLGHINFKNINKLVKGNLVKGLPSKIFQNDHSCIACQKGKQHKASYKAKHVKSITKPLHMLHMDLFGPTNVKSLMKKSYCLVVTDDFSRFSWLFFLATKDETSGILKTFIIGIENQLDHKVKFIRCDNGTEFKNSVMNQFCDMKRIKREFSVARTPQQNGVAERKNRTLIEAARTMLVDFKLPTTFWAEAVNYSPCYDFMKPFGCPITILNTRDHLGNFEGKADEGFFIRYSVVNKAMGVFNKRTRIVEETLNIRFLENASNVKGNGPDWLFDVDSLKISMNYVPVSAGNQTNGIAEIKDNTVAGPKNNEENAGKKPTEVAESGVLDNGRHDDQRSKLERLLQQEKQTEHINSTNCVNTVSPPEHLFEQFSPFKNAFALLHVPNVSSMDNTGIFGNAYDDEDVEEEVDMNNVISSYSVPDTSFTKFHKDHHKNQVIGSLETPV